MYMGEAQNLGFTFRSRSSSQGSGAAGTRQASKFPGTSCPPNMDLVSHAPEMHAPKYIGGPNQTDYVYCKPYRAPAPVQAPPPPAPNINVQTTVSPTLQTDISPQISPVFSQMQDSPGSTQAATTAQVKPGGMKAEGGGTSSGSDEAMLEFLRQQQLRDDQRRAEETAARERARVDEQRRADAMQAAQIENQRLVNERNAALQAQQLEMQRLQAEQAAAAEAGRLEQAAQLQAQYDQQRLEWEKTQSTPPQMVATPSVMPGRQMIPADAPIADLPAPPPESGLPLPLPVLIGIGIAVLGGGYYLYTKKGKRR